MQKSYNIILLIFLFNVPLFSQTNYPLNYFDSPTKNQLTLVGNFGEIRPNHFHAGFDIRTNGQEGMPVYAVADGYISRIKIGPDGYGKALYITHPNGYTSVYGHLQGFTKDIAAYAKKIQYAKESFEIDTLIAPDKLPETKGQQIALSGNTGATAGPHLHFEIRNTKTEMPINPYYFGYKIPDNVKPRITELAVYPIGKAATVNGKHNMKIIKPSFTNNKYAFGTGDTIIVNGDIGFGIECYDSETGSNNHNGVFSIELKMGNKRIYYDELETFSFDNSRYVNAHIDYAEKQKHGDVIQKCFVSKNNKLGIYKGVVNGGIINFKDDSIHLIKYIVKDFAGNTTELDLKVKSTSKSSYIPNEPAQKYIPFDCSKENKLDNYQVKADFSPLTYYDDINFTYSKTLDIKALYAPLHHIHNAETAVQKPYSLSIKVINMVDSLQKKACIISISDKGKVTYEGGTFKAGWVTTKTNHLGNFTIGIDNVPPKIIADFKIIPNREVDFTNAKTIDFTVTDNLSGIKKYRGTIDGKWVLFEYEEKKDLLFYTFDDTIKPGKHSFKIEVSDDKNNTSTLSFNFKR